MDLEILEKTSLLRTSKMAARAAGVTLGQMEAKTVLQTCRMWRLGRDSRDNKRSTITSTHSGSSSTAAKICGFIYFEPFVASMLLIWCLSPCYGLLKPLTGQTKTWGRHLRVTCLAFVMNSNPLCFFFFLAFFSWALSTQLCRSFMISRSSSGAFGGIRF